jgi:hypothetical protein
MSEHPIDALRDRLPKIMDRSARLTGEATARANRALARDLCTCTYAMRKHTLLLRDDFLLMYGRSSGLNELPKLREEADADCMHESALTFGLFEELLCAVERLDPISEKPLVEQFSVALLALLQGADELQNKVAQRHGIAC